MSQHYMELMWQLFFHRTGIQFKETRHPTVLLPNIKQTYKSFLLRSAAASTTSVWVAVLDSSTLCDLCVVCSVGAVTTNLGD